MRTARYALLAAGLFRIALAVPAVADENPWISHGPSDVGWITDVAIGDSAVYAATLNGVFLSYDRGITWRQSALAGERIDQVLAGAGEGAIYARGGSGPPYFATTALTLYVSRDKGQSWAPSGLPAISSVALDPGHPSTAFAASADGRLMKSTDAGASWRLASQIPGDRQVFGLTADSLAIYVLTGLGLYKSVDGGASWTAPTQPKESVSVIFSGKSGALYAVSQDGFFCSSVDGAGTWACSPFPGYVSAAIRIAELPGDSQNPGPRILASYAEGLLLSRDAGATWTQTQGIAWTDVAAPHGIASDESGSLVLAGDEQGVLRSLDRGDTWGAFRAGLQAAWIDAVAPDPQNASRIWAASRSGGLFRSTDAGLSWSALDHTGSSWVTAIAVDPRQQPSTIYLGGDKIYRTEDGGATWKVSNSSPRFAGSLALDPDSPQTVWATAGDLFKSEDGAKTWRSMAQAMSCVLLDQKRAGSIYTGAFFGTVEDDGYDYPYGGAIFVSRDRGETFTKNSKDFGSQVIAIVQDPSPEGKLYAATSLGIFRSADAGVTWQGTSTSPPRFIEALLADPVRPGRLYAGTSNGIYRTTDGGESWLPFSLGVAHSPVSSLAISPDGKWLHAGTWGSGVFQIDLDLELEGSYPRLPPVLRAPHRPPPGVSGRGPD